jgi:hypothetical protein
VNVRRILDSPRITEQQSQLQKETWRRAREVIMAGKKEETGIKSALELAMERMEKKGGSVPVLSAEQKEALSRVDREFQAKIAEEEILTGQQVAEARAQGDVEGAAQLEERKAGEIGRLRRRAEKERKAIRQGGQ